MKSDQNFDATKTEMSPILKCHKNWKVTNTEISPKLKKSPKLKIHQKFKVTKTEMSSKLKCHKKIKVTKTWNVIKTGFYNWTLKFNSRKKLIALAFINFYLLYVNPEPYYFRSVIRTAVNFIQWFFLNADCNHQTYWNLPFWLVFERIKDFCWAICL